MKNKHFARVAVGLAATLTLGLIPATLVEANATPVSSVAVQAVLTSTLAAGATSSRGPDPSSGARAPSSGANHADLIWGGIWAPHFEPTMTQFGRAGTFFVYVGNTPVGWVEMPATGEFGGTITLATEHGSYRKGTQRIALYDPRGRLVAWDWITLQWDW